MSDNVVYDPVELVKDLADQIGIDQLYAIARDLRGKSDATINYDGVMKQNEALKEQLRYQREDKAMMQGEINGLRFALRCNGVSGGEVN